jgi:hypothetical protein
MPARSLAIDRTDLLLVLFTLVSILSGTFAASDNFEATQAIGLTISGIAVFWSARHLARLGQRQPLLDAVAIAIILVSATVLLDAFGYGPDFPYGRSQGTQGNRNWAAHLLALGMPLLTLQSLGGQTGKRRIVGLCALMVAAAALVLTRSRAAWIAAALGTGFPLILQLAGSRRLNASASTPRACAALGAMVAGLILAVMLPTQLRWSSESPYLDTIENLTVHDRGSGLIRMQQYSRSMAMAADHPLLGVGPGNWKIIYPEYLPGRTPPGVWYAARSMSDWIGIASERGTPALILFLAALLSLAVGCGKAFMGVGKTNGSVESSLQPLCALQILITLVVLGSLDAVLQLPAPTFITFLSLGALAPRQDTIVSLSLPRCRRMLAVGMMMVFAAALGLYIVDGMYAVFLLVRDRGNDAQVASQIALDADWLYNQKTYISLRKARMAATARSSAPP